VFQTGLHSSPRRPPRDQAEKPFWISFSDLMTSLMVLFMVTMAVALLSITTGVNKIEAEKVARDEAIRACMADVRTIAAGDGYAGVSVAGNAIEFGHIAEFQKRGHDLPAENRTFLRKFMPPLLKAARSEKCARWLKHITVEGYASPEGSYLYNLNLSLQRSQRVLCSLLDSRAPDALSEDDRKFIRMIFLVGGVSFNATKDRPERSRRIELKMEFREVGERKIAHPELPWDDDPRCPLDQEK
jgi:hypothetical protein